MDNEAEIEARAYCDRLAQMILAYELDPRNFTKAMRARHGTATKTGGIIENYNGYSSTSALPRR